MCVWIEDADGIQMDDKSLGIVYENSLIRSFMNSSTSKMLGISGIKGQGKTFLLKVKRSRAMKEGILCFPQYNMVDQLDKSTIINKSNFKFMEDYTKWVSIWKIAIIMTMLKYKNCGLEKKDLLSQAPDAIRTLYEQDNINYRPSLYFKLLLEMNRKDLNQSIKYTPTLIYTLQYIHTPIYFFVDKIDQAFSIDIHKIYGDSKMSRGPRNASYWQYSQYALAEASYDIFNANNHIKVFYSIRQEALIDSSGLAPNLARNIEAYIVNLDYDKADLKCMFDIYVQHEDDNNLVNFGDKDKNPIKAFLGMETLGNRHVAQSENAFDYIYRHSMKRPSDIMKICRKLSFMKKENNIDEIRRTVNNCAGEILNQYMEELSPFLPYQIDDFYAHINTNILNKDYIRYICKRYLSHKVQEYTCSKDCNNCSNMHPFTVLYNIGLLGYLKDDINNHKQIQYFNRAGSSVFLEKLEQFPESDYYFVHPCLMDVIHEQRHQCGLEHFTDNEHIVGDLYDFSRHSDDKIDENIKAAQRKLKKEDIFVSSTIFDLEFERNMIEDVLMSRGYNPIMSEKNDFPLESDHLSLVHSHDYCIDKMLECGSLIFVIGKEYGGPYSGNAYNELKQEIIKKSNGKIDKPSISLMEFYAAVKENLIHYIFISKQYDDEQNRQSDWDDNVINEYNFINHLALDGTIKDNWVSRYDNIDDLSIRIKHLSFK